MARDLGVSTPTVFAAFSAALVVSALVGPSAGRAIDQRGGKPVLIATNIVFAIGLVTLATAHSILGLFAGWLVLGIGMGSGLYDAAFAAIVRLYGTDSRGAITGVTLFAGFASTVGWPLSSWLQVHYDWRVACFAWAALHLTIGLPLNLSIPSAVREPTSGSKDRPEAGPEGKRNGTDAVALAYVFAVTWFVSTAMAAHLPGVLMAAGATLGTALLVGTLVGPAQVVARILEFGLLRRVHPLGSARLATLMHPLGASLLLTLGTPLAIVFGVLHGAGNGILTIAKGTLPLVIFGTSGYGRRQGVLMAPARIAQALAPWLFGLCLERWGAASLWVSSALGVTAFGALLFLDGTRRHVRSEVASDGRSEAIRSDGSS